MKEYQSIRFFPRDFESEQYYGFNKLDGSQIRVEYNKKKKHTTWTFGTRHHLLTDTEPYLAEAKLLIEEHIPVLESIFHKANVQEGTAFFEFLGENSFAGGHQPEPHHIVLFDLHFHKKGIISPREFIKATKIYNIPVPELLSFGVPDQKLIDQIQEGKLPGITSEGVVFKSAKVYQKHGGPKMFKVKTDAWFLKLMHRCKGNNKLFEELK